jgi:hypothetical protein
MKTREIALAGIIIALQVITLLIVYIFPTIKLALLFASSLYLGVILRLGIHKSIGIITYIASSALILLFVHVVEIKALYIAFFGWYGIIYESTNHLKTLPKQAFRWLSFILACAILYFAVTFLIKIDLQYALYLYAIFGVIGFVAMQVLYELCIKEIIRLTGIRIIEGKIVFKQ